MYDNYIDEMVAVLQLHLIKVGVYWLSLYNLLIKMTCCDFKNVIKVIENDQTR